MKKTRTVKIGKLPQLVVVFLFLIIIIKLLYVGLSPIVDGINIKKFADNRNTRKEVINAKRGSIFDRNKEILAQDVNSYTVIAYLDESRTTDKNHPYHVVDKKMTAEKLSPIINMSVETIYDLLQRDVYQVELGPGGRGITELVKEQIEKLNLPGIDFIKSVKRYYPNSNFLSNVLGYAKTDENGNIIGELGLELFYNDTLTGKNGYKEYQSDMYGYQIANTSPLIEKSVDGSDIYLTIDTNIQIFTEQAIKEISDNKVDWGVIGVMDALTGEILAVSSTPNFDPNIKNVKSYYDPFVSYLFEPGSTMKIFSFMASMENGLYNGDEKYHSGYIMIGKDKISDWNKYGWGDITFDRGFYASSNVAASLLSQKLGKEKLKNFYDSIGLGVKTGINLPNEQVGKVKFKYDIELANASFGQGISVTPIQMLQALSCLSNDGTIIKPYIVKSVKKGSDIIYEGSRKEIRKVASSSTIKKILEMMYQLVNSDDNVATGTQFKIDKVAVAGKTGTAEIASESGGYLTGYYDYIRSFVGVFPYEKPQIIVYGAASKLTDLSLLPKVMRSLMENISIYLNLTDSGINIKNGVYEVDGLMNTNLEKITKNLKSNSFDVIIIGNGKNIIDQYPKKGTKINKGEKIFLLTDGTEKKVPDMTGWSRNDVSIFSNLSNIPILYDGYGYVKECNLKVGEIIKPNTTLKIKLETKYKKEDKQEHKTTN